MTIKNIGGMTLIVKTEYCIAWLWYKVGVTCTIFVVPIVLGTELTRRARSADDPTQVSLDHTPNRSVWAKDFQMSLSGSMHDRMFGGPTSGGYPSSYPANGMLASMGRQEGSRIVQSGMPVQYGYGQPMSQPMPYGQQMYREPPPVSMNSFMQHPNISQYNMQASMREREGMMINREQDRLRSEGEVVIRLNTELTQSRAECERLAASLRNNEGGNQQLSEEYRMLRQQMENKENEYRRLWSNEEARIRGISEETRKTVDNIRSNLIGALEKMDVTNKNMLETAESLMHLDREMDAVARADGL